MHTEIVYILISWQQEIDRNCMVKYSYELQYSMWEGCVKVLYSRSHWLLCHLEEFHRLQPGSTLAARTLGEKKQKHPMQIGEF